jgi:hypothetical protein
MNKFALGKVVMTQGIAGYIEDNPILNSQLINFIKSHATGDWGELPEEDKELNDDAVKNGGRILSSYKLGEEKIYIITEWDRSYTTVLFPSEY